MATDRNTNEDLGRGGSSDELNEERAVDIVSHNVRQFRHDKGWTQEQLANAAGIDRSYLGHLESSGRNISIKKLFALADALGVDPRELLDPALKD